MVVELGGYSLVLLRWWGLRPVKVSVGMFIVPVVVVIAVVFAMILFPGWGGGEEV